MQVPGLFQITYQIRHFFT